MGATGVKLTGPARRDKASEAYCRAIRRESYTEIGKALDISRNLVSTLVQEEQERLWEGRDLSEVEGEKRRAVETYESVIRTAWQRLGRIKDSSLNVSGLLNVILSAQKQIDAITGVASVEGIGKDDPLAALVRDWEEGMRSEGKLESRPQSEAT